MSKVPSSDPLPAAAPDAPPAEVPAGRWEWRSFGYDPDLWRRILGHAISRHTSELAVETYFISRVSRLNAKLRDGMIDVRGLHAVSADGLEQWRPLFRTPFPLSGTHQARLAAAWRCEALRDPPLINTAETLTFRTARCSDLQTVPVRKWRRGFTLHGCGIDRVTLLARGQIHESLGFEHEDPAILRHTLETLGLKVSSNVSYSRMLRRQTGWPDIDPGLSIERRIDD